jgi:hypothetical protein
MRSRDRVVGIATGCSLDKRGIRSSSPDRVKNFLFSTSSRPPLVPIQPPIEWAYRIGTGGSLSGVKR